MRESKRPSYKRHWYNYFLLNRMQNMMILFTLLPLLFLFAGLYYIFQDYITTISRIIPMVGKEGQEQLTQFVSDSSFLPGMFFIFIAIALIFLIQVVFISHKIFGPIVHLKRHFRELAEKKSYDHIVFRKKDQLKDLADEINHYLDVIKPH